MIKKVIVFMICVLFFTGCYDKNDIENIKSIALICVDNSSIYYYSVTAQNGEKKYNSEVYKIGTDDLYYGIDKISEITGKKVSMSHLDAIIFSVKCDYKLIKRSINSLLEGTNTHPKIMTAFYDGDFETFFNDTQVPEYTSLGKITDKILTNNQKLITGCSAMELSLALNFDVPGKLVPVIKLENGHIINSGSMFVDNTDNVYVDNTTTQLISLFKNKSGESYLKWKDKTVFVKLEKTYMETDKQSAKVKLVFDKNTIKDKREFYEIISYFKQNILIMKNNGFDVLGLGISLNRTFRDIPEKDKFIKSSKGIRNWIINVDLKIEVDV